MPSLNDVIEIAELLKSRPVVAAEERCVAVRNRNASCRKCAEACLAGCIEVGQNSLEIDAGACVNCGACLTVCPTGALVGLDPIDDDVVEGSAAVISCARAASWNMADPARFAAVPCLGRIGEELLVEIAQALGGADLLLVDGNCATCKYGAVSPFIDEACDGARALLAAFEVPIAIERASAFPEEVLLPPGKDARSMRGQERRSLLKDAKRFAGSAAKTAAEKAIADALHQQKPGEPTLRDRLKVNPHGALPTFPATRNLNILDALCELAEAEGGAALDAVCVSSEAIETRLFGDVGIDLETCTGCGMCAMFCPTGALSFSEVAEPAEEGMRYLEFQAADCTQCNLCADVCLHGSVTVSSRVALAELLDFEPRLLLTPKPRKSIDIFKQSRQARSNNHGRS